MFLWQVLQLLDLRASPCAWLLAHSCALWCPACPSAGPLLAALSWCCIILLLLLLLYAGAGCDKKERHYNAARAYRFPHDRTGGAGSGGFCIGAARGELGSSAAGTVKQH